MSGTRSTLTLQPMTTSDALRLANRLVGCFPSSSTALADKPVFVAALAELLARYPLWVGERVVTHLVLTEKWLPPIASVFKRCEEDIGPARRAAEWDKAARTVKLAKPDEVPRPTLEELKAKHGPTWGIRVIK